MEIKVHGEGTITNIGQKTHNAFKYSFYPLKYHRCRSKRLLFRTQLNKLYDAVLIAKN